MGLSGVSSDRWWRDILGGLNAPDTANNRSNLSAWTNCEGGTARYNPFNTTLSWPGSTCYNSVCVRNYKDYQTGLLATLSTIKQSNMEPISHALRSNYNRDSFAAAIDAAPWGTSGACIRSAPGGPIGGGAPPTGPVHGPAIPPPPKERRDDDWSGHIRRSAAQFGNTGRVLMKHAVIIRNLRER